jgi:hypothetical protein
MLVDNVDCFTPRPEPRLAFRGHYERLREVRWLQAPIGHPFVTFFLGSAA